MLDAAWGDDCVVTATTTPLWFTPKLPGETVDRTFDVATLPTPLAAGDIAILGAQIAPSGDGEMAAITLTLVGTTITLGETSGEPGRVYAILFTATLQDTQIVQWIVNQGVSPIPPPDDIPPPPVPGFGTEITWMPTSNNVASTELETAHLLSPIACSVINIQANTTSAGGWIMLLDADEIPIAGAVAPLRWWQVTAGATLAQTFTPPLTMVNGAVLLFSSDIDPFTFTESPTALFAGEIA